MTAPTAIINAQWGAHYAPVVMAAAQGGMMRTWGARAAAVCGARRPCSMLDSCMAPDAPRDGKLRVTVCIMEPRRALMAAGCDIPMQWPAMTGMVDALCTASTELPSL